MRLSQLLENVCVVERKGFRDVEIGGVSTDSRRVGRGDLFAAIRGSSADGHDYAAEAVGRGAAALLVEHPVDAEVPVIVVRETAAAVGLVSRRFFGDPASGMTLVGITGTNGKTSTAFLLQAILERAVGPTGIIGTVGSGRAGELVAATHTTPAPVDLYRIIAGFRDRGVRAVVMEVSSHAAAQDRISGLEYDTAVFTNITRDHLDYHGTFDAYVEAKEKLARSLLLPDRGKERGILVYNADDAYVEAIGKRFSGSKISYGVRAEAEVRMEGLRADLGGTEFTLLCGGESTRVRLRLLGAFSAYNALAAAAAAHALGIDRDAVKDGLESVDSVPGRFEVVRTGHGPVVVIDYAHTPDALDNLLRFCRALGPSRLVAVFGAGGDRDRGKRPEMGRIALAYADFVYVTDDNPRTEDARRIVDEILEGMTGGGERYEVVPDRATAIARAVETARTGEMVVIAGKGHENYQIVGTEKIPFSDFEEARRALERQGARDEA